MSPEFVITIGRQTLEVVVMLVSAILIPALITGLLVSMVQAATSINEMTLTFIPKLLVTFTVLIIGGPWMIGILTDFTRRIITSIPTVIG